MNYPHAVVRGGFRCAITGRVFEYADHTRAERRRCFREQQRHTGEVMHELERRFGRGLPIADYKRLYREGGNDDSV